MTDIPTVGRSVRHHLNDLADHVADRIYVPAVCPGAGFGPSLRTPLRLRAELESLPSTTLSDGKFKGLRASPWTSENR